MIFKRSSKPRKIIFTAVAVVVIATVIYFATHGFLLPIKTYSAEDFHIKTVHSTVDFNRNDIDDYTDFLNGARKDARNRPRYDAAYVMGGYPSDDTGVCADVVWRAFREAGYSLKDMVDRDIRKNCAKYPGTNGKPDPNIDFRRVVNLKVYFERHAESLTLDLDRIAEWQPGDIITFSTTHVGILSDRRDEKGIPLLIHNSGQPRREEDGLPERESDISGHFRFDSSKLPKTELIPFQK